MMMLRASTAPELTNPTDPVDEAAIAVDRRSALLEEFVAAVVGADPVRADDARSALIDQLGVRWLVDASAVVANFEMMTRLADATGARLRPEQFDASESIRTELGLDAFPSARR
jgi:hypothetical protein